MTDGQGVVRRMTGLVLAEGCAPARIECGFDPSDPFAVTVAVAVGSIGTPRPPVTWVIARELVVGGLDHRVGEGDVQVRPLSPEWTLIELGCPDRSAIVLVATEDLRDFVAATFDVVAEGAESAWLDWDAVLRQLSADT
ncbi:SsgA family sporulation/cell division regulator [Streptacidiphilus jiangxiensis]|uniref:Streptomyces sporulation and cell division protein, SsgA n=1 Tax=Streptacidiphilus jiangxiensis TaxID=235985 RepID=A0A1H7WAB9_STRJI|nr:SsgA family sporulation/cell division regulator [Streptacidiphilus jiangxiensis]SEM18284.1 Streptomyces sporulation and cell division protein, SsgA [Streptacidiphilus jiangxiensis]